MNAEPRNLFPFCPDCVQSERPCPEHPGNFPLLYVPKDPDITRLERENRALRAQIEELETQIEEMANPAIRARRFLASRVSGPLPVAPLEPVPLNNRPDGYYQQG